MKDLETELLREKIVLHDSRAKQPDGKKPTIALSNRMVLPLVDEEENIRETIIIRSHNMHGCARMAGRLIQGFLSSGSIVNRILPYDWESAWDFVAGEYEQSYNPQRWIAIYHDGKMVFQKGEHHSLLDIIERCAQMAPGKYADAIPMAEKIISKSGAEVKIEYDANVALTVNLANQQGRCGIILRTANKTTTFNFSVSTKATTGINFPQCLNASAAFLEGIQLAFTVGMNNEKIKYGIITRHSPEEKQTKDGATRLTRLNAEIANMEGTFNVHYRPERPEFGQILLEAEALGQKLFAPKKK